MDVDLENPLAFRQTCAVKSCLIHLYLVTENETGKES